MKEWRKKKRRKRVKARRKRNRRNDSMKVRGFNSKDFREAI